MENKNVTHQANKIPFQKDITLYSCMFRFTLNQHHQAFVKKNLCNTAVLQAL